MKENLLNQDTNAKQMKMPRKLQAQQTKNNIIEVTIKLAEEKGLFGFSLRDICTEAGISIGNFYHYFKSKDEVLLYTRNPLTKTILSEIQKIDKKDTIELILDIYDTRARCVVSMSIEEISVLYLGNLKNTSEVYGVDEYTLKVISETLKKSKITSNFDAKEILTLINSVYHGCCHEYIIRKGSYDLVKNSRFLLKTVLKEIMHNR